MSNMADAQDAEAKVELKVQKLKQFLKEELSWQQHELGSRHLRSLDPNK